MEAADVKEEVETAETGGLKVCHIAHHEGGAGDGPAAGYPYGSGDGVDADGLPAPPSELAGVQATAAAEIQRPAERMWPRDAAKRLHSLLRVEPGRFGRNVDAVFTRGERIARSLGR